MAVEAKEYQVVLGEGDVLEFEMGVNDALSKGWKIIPEGFRTVFTGDQTLFYQSMYLPTEVSDAK